MKTLGSEATGPTNPFRVNVTCWRFSALPSLPRSCVLPSSTLMAPVAGPIDMMVAGDSATARLVTTL